MTDEEIMKLLARAEKAEAEVARLRPALELAEDVLSRAPHSTTIWANGMHPNTGVELIRAALRASRPDPAAPSRRRSGSAISATARTSSTAQMA
jgi:hypothetical protein